MIRLFETISGVWFYHLREDKDEFKPGGAIDVMLCGKKMQGWDTGIPLNTWGVRDHLPSKYCKGCTEAAIEKGIIDEDNRMGSSAADRASMRAHGD
jgi:hypothetical protein